MHIFDDIDYTNKAATNLYNHLKQKYKEQFIKSEEFKCLDADFEYYADHMYLDEEFDKFLLNVCQDIYNDRDLNVIKELINE